jgi:hypothetical protein
VMGGYNAGLPGAVSGAITGATMAAINPGLALANAVSAMMGGPTIGQAINSAVNNVSTAFSLGTNIGSEQTGMLATQNMGMGGFGAAGQNGSSTAPDATATGYGTNANSQQTAMLAEQDFGFNFGTGMNSDASSAGMGGASVGSAGSTAGTASSPDGPDGNNAGQGFGGDSSGSGGGKIVCTAMNEAYGFGSFRNRIWLAYAAKNLTKEHEIGYHRLFLPLVNAAYKQQRIYSKPLRNVLEHIARHRSADLRAEMRGTKRDTIGRAYRFVLEPLCYLAGKL